MNKDNDEHVHKYIRCLFKSNSDGELLAYGKFCTECGKIFGVLLFEDEELNHIQKDYRNNLPIITINTIWDEYVSDEVLLNE